MRLARRVILWAGGLLVALAGVLAVEVVLAVNGRNLPARRPLRLDGRFGPAGGTPMSVVWLGDSTGSGVGASAPATALPAVVAEELGRPVELRVTAVSGARVAGVLDGQVEALGRVPADVVVLAIGSNDVSHLTGRDVFAARYDAVLRAIEAVHPGALVVTVGVGNFDSVPRFAQPLRAIAGWRARLLAEVIERTSRRHGVPFVDIHAETGAAFAADPDRYYAADAYHPNDEGYRLWADAVLEVLRPAVERRFPA
jgi:lysophospholipase L1-like esterase